MKDIFVGRQPIYNRRLECFGYELLFRNGDRNQAGPRPGDRATWQVISNAMVEIGLDAIVGQKLAFINHTHNSLVEDYATVIPPDRAVIEVLEDVDVDGDLISALRAFSERGYTIALDDLVYHDSLRPLLEVADIIKLDLPMLDEPALIEHVALLRPYRVKLLAEKVETPEDFRRTADLGFDYFQGYFLCRPDIVKGRRAPANRLAVLRLLAKLQDPGADLGEIGDLIGHDAALSYRLMRVINSASVYVTPKVESIHQALLLLGTQLVAKLATLLILAGVDDKPQELIVTALVRARMCELLAQAMGRVQPDRFFLVGLFSTLDALLDAPLEQTLRHLPLADETTDALLRRTGELGWVLDTALAYERGDWDKVECSGLSAEQIRGSFLGAVAWAAHTTGDLSPRQAA